MEKPIHRERDWQSRLADCIDQHRPLPFEWGTNDCVTFAADCVAATTGVDPAAEVRGTYTSALGAARMLERCGGLGEIAAAALGPEIRPLMAQPGDIGLIQNSGNPCLAVCTGMQWVAPATDGLGLFPITDALSAWRLCAVEVA